MVVASSYRAIAWNQEDTAHQQVGADWRIEVDPEQALAALDRCRSMRPASCGSCPTWRCGRSSR